MGSFIIKFRQVFVLACSCSYCLFFSLASSPVSIFIHPGLPRMSHSSFKLTKNSQYTYTLCRHSWWLNLPLTPDSTLYIYRLSLVSVTKLIHPDFLSFILYLSPSNSKLIEEVLILFLCSQFLRYPWSIALLALFCGRC